MLDPDQKIADQIEFLRSSEEALAQAATRLNQRFTEIEVALREHASVSASVQLRQVDPESEPCVSLAFRRHKGKPSLVITSSLGPDCSDEVTPITSAPLRHRVEAATLLPELIHRLGSKACKIAESALRAYNRLEGTASVSPLVG